jgi:two-component system, chemotaxis family, chemotaxis protein CheY
MSPSDVTSGSSRGLVLIVEDNDDVRTAMKTVLELEQYRAVTVGDGEEALQVLRGGLQPGLILLDLAMPRKDGFQFRAEQLQDPKLARIPVVVYSGAGNVDEKAAALGITAFLHKPIEIDELLELVARNYAAGAGSSA